MILTKLFQEESSVQTILYKCINCKKIILDKLIIAKNMIIINSYQIQMNEN